MARIRSPEREGETAYERASSTPIRRRAVQAGIVAILVAATLFAAFQVLGGATLAVAPAATPWARIRAPAHTALVQASPAPTDAAGGIGPSGTPSPTPVPTPKPGPFAMDLYEKGDYVREYIDTWCLPAAMQTSMNIMDSGADTSYATQERLWRLARSLVPDREGGAEPEAWAQALTKLGYGGYRISIQPTLEAAIHVAARQVRLTMRPAGLLVWKGVHAWVMSGFKATRDPAQTDKFRVTAVYVEDVWYPRLSSIWGYSRPPDALVPVNALPEDFLRWHLLYDGPHPDKDGKYVIVIPVNKP